MKTDKTDKTKLRTLRSKLAIVKEELAVEKVLKEIATSTLSTIAASPSRMNNKQFADNIWNLIESLRNTEERKKL
jgi:hypothetical protein